MMMAKNANPPSIRKGKTHGPFAHKHTHTQEKNNNKIVADISTNNNAKIKDKVEAVKTNNGKRTAEMEQKRRIRQE